MKRSRWFAFWPVGIALLALTFVQFWAQAQDPNDPDGTPPNFEGTSLTPSVSAGVNFFVRSGSVIDIQAQDEPDGSGLYVCTGRVGGISLTCPTRFSPNELGLGAGDTVLVSFEALDNAGNTGTLSFTITVDDAPPVVNFYIDPGASYYDGTTLYVRSNTPFDGSVSDEGSGLAFCQVTIDNARNISLRVVNGVCHASGVLGSLFKGDGFHEGALYVEDQLGNSTSFYISFVLDDSPPSNPTGFFSPSHTKALDQWASDISNNSSIKLAWNGDADDGGGSGVLGYSILCDNTANPMALRGFEWVDLGVGHLESGSGRGT